MSYILEALKKAQAERQLGSAPTIHDMPVHVPQHGGSHGNRVPLMAAAALGGALLVAGGAFLWWGQTVPPVQVAAGPAAEPMRYPDPAPLPVPDVLPPPPPPPAPVAVAPAVQPAAPKPAPVKPVAARKPEPKLAVAAPPAPAPQAAPEPDTPSPEDSLPTLRALPQAVQSQLPQVTFGGYMYSKNPADRLLLIDKVLRREGEEVAPGLILEKLLPKAAVMNYRGTRYRMAL